eukprot:gene8919-biopygen2463
MRRRVAVWRAVWNAVRRRVAVRNAVRRRVAVLPCGARRAAPCGAVRRHLPRGQRRAALCAMIAVQGLG